MSGQKMAQRPPHFEFLISPGGGGASRERCADDCPHDGSSRFLSVEGTVTRSVGQKIGTVGFVERLESRGICRLLGQVSSNLNNPQSRNVTIENIIVTFRLGNECEMAKILHTNDFSVFLLLSYPLQPA